MWAGTEVEKRASHERKGLGITISRRVYLRGPLTSDLKGKGGIAEEDRVVEDAAHRVEEIGGVVCEGTAADMAEFGGVAHAQAVVHGRQAQCWQVRIK